MSGCTPRTVCRTLGSSPGTAGGTREASSPQLRCCPPSPPDPEHSAANQTTRKNNTSQPQPMRRQRRSTDLLVFGDRVKQLDVQFGVVLGEGLVAVMVDELHHRAEGQRVGKAVLPLAVEDLYQLIVASFPESGETPLVRQAEAFNSVSIQTGAQHLSHWAGFHSVWCACVRVYLRVSV